MATSGASSGIVGPRARLAAAPGVRGGPCVVRGGPCVFVGDRVLDDSCVSVGGWPLASVGDWPLASPSSPLASLSALRFVGVLAMIAMFQDECAWWLELELALALRLGIKNRYGDFQINIDREH